MLCEEKLEVFENGFKDDKHNIEIHVYGGDGRKVLLALIYELYSPEYGSEYVYPFECAKEFWGIYLDSSEVKGEEAELKPLKFISESVKSKIEKELEDIKAPIEVELEKSTIYKVKDGYIVLGKNFLLDHKGRLFVFNKPQVGEIILKYIWKW
ncbi:hypothetical protein PFDSM3638_07995 [Pyrococcus furiosus DSM 3638]|uniref:PH1570-like domain-containing protein n=3 Tax=Pyrococcus furiosus TaxID=2261 RepID=A0A5C0XQT8_PYRFU|nr:MULTISPECIES: PH1570 family protein [Pyrococcus]AAL81708.1 hypothetical protein PF1584 [Pyrococcus furiosus DSM 3638]AFN04366.1 hypothetical protein PFC_07150 [Pyrococcus furiosus COM1]MDK2869702.1 hypothetical protein [Pyrococcus sp.]QEK79207.1 hypothetical protein PFDSM3638_07995 [Pyrococcus furiosus DSM 3638]